MYVQDVSHIIAPESIQIKGNQTYKPEPIQIIDKSTKILKNKKISLVKEVWEGLTPKEATCELDEDVSCQYLNLIN